MRTSTLLLVLVACQQQRDGDVNDFIARHALRPSTDQKENAELVKSLCSDDAYQILAIGHVEIACCAGSVDVWYPDKCVGAHPSDYAKDNFCDQTPIGGHLYINRAGTWWCCGGGQCGN